MDTKIPHSRVTAIVKGRRSVSADTALRLARYFGNSPEFWLGLQQDYDLRNLQEAALLVKEEVTPYGSKTNAKSKDARRARSKRSRRTGF